MGKNRSIANRGRKHLAREHRIAYIGARFIGAMALVLLLVLSTASLASAQRNNTFYVDQFTGRTVADRVTAAQLECNANTAIPCIIVFDPILAGFAEGTLPAKCTQCTWLDWRTSGAQTLGTVSGYSAAISGHHYESIFTRTTTESLAPDHYYSLGALNWQTSGGVQSGGKTKPYAAEFELVKQATGEGGALRLNSYCGGDGDCIGLQSFVYPVGNCMESGGECAEGARLHVEQSSTQVFTGTISTATDNGANWTLAYTDAASIYSGANRYVINTTGAKTYTTGTVSTIAGSPPTVTFNATDASRDSWFAALGYSSGVTNANPGACLRVTGDDNSSVKFVVPVRSYTAAAATIVLGYDGAQGVDAAYPITTAAGAYVLYPCGKATAVSYASKTFTVTEGAANWAATDTIEMPLGYSWHGEGLRVVVNQQIPNAVNYPSAGVTVVAQGRRVGNGFWINSGTYGNGLNLSGGTYSAGTSAISSGIYYGTVFQGSVPANLINCIGATCRVFQVSGTGINSILGYSDTGGIFTFGSSSGGNKFTIAASSGNTVVTGTVTVGAGATAIVSGAASTRNAVRTEFASVAIGSVYLSTAGKMYLKVANAAADTDWQRVTTTAVD